jgi:hypothetical protein
MTNDKKLFFLVSSQTRFGIQGFGAIYFVLRIILIIPTYPWVPDIFTALKILGRHNVRFLKKQHFFRKVLFKKPWVLLGTTFGSNC